tara:strand:- start:442 stop:648 length:207 start_codon:yes stop_codon:yes gene_type:complete
VDNCAVLGWYLSVIYSVGDGVKRRWAQVRLLRAGYNRGNVPPSLSSLMLGQSLLTVDRGSNGACNPLI